MDNPLHKNGADKRGNFYLFVPFTYKLKERMKELSKKNGKAENSQHIL